MSRRTTYDAALSVTCPKCFADYGVRCTNAQAPTGDPRYLTKAHARRISKARFEARRRRRR